MTALAWIAWGAVVAFLLWRIWRWRDRIAEALNEFIREDIDDGT